MTPRIPAAPPEEVAGAAGSRDASRWRRRRRIHLPEEGLPQQESKHKSRRHKGGVASRSSREGSRIRCSRNKAADTRPGRPAGSARGAPTAGTAGVEGRTAGTAAERQPQRSSNRRRRSSSRGPDSRSPQLYWDQRKQQQGQRERQNPDRDQRKQQKQALQPQQQNQGQQKQEQQRAQRVPQQKPNKPRVLRGLETAS
nr:regulator of nonsense transcripts 1-like [Penaeus vannamei]